MNANDDMLGRASSGKFTAFLRKFRFGLGVKPEIEEKKLKKSTEKIISHFEVFK